MAGRDPRIQTVEQLARQLRRLQRDGAQPSVRGGERLVSTGLAALDALLPEGGLRRGSLIEWLMEGRGSGAGTLVFLIAAGLTRGGEGLSPGALIVIDSDQQFYPPAAQSLGIDLQRTIVVRPAGEGDAWWAWEQSLRCSGVAVSAGVVERLDDRVFRRLQLAAEAGGGLGFLLRRACYRGQPSWADVRLRVIPQPVSSASVFSRRLRVELVRGRGALHRRSVELEIDDETGVVRLVTELAPAENPRRASRA